MAWRGFGLSYTGIPIVIWSAEYQFECKAATLTISANIQLIAPLMDRRVLAILVADVVGYAKLTEAAEEATHIVLRELRFRVV